MNFNPSCQKSKNCANSELPAFVKGDVPECPALHYFAVKALSCFAGFSHEEAQIIAEYAQFLGDNATSAGLPVEEITEELNEKKLYFNSETGILVPIIPTSMKTWYNETEIETKIPWFGASAGDKRTYDTITDILRPFHFYPPSSPSNPGNPPVVRFNPSNLHNRLTEIEKEAQKAERHPGTDLLMKIGVYIHILADTMLHERFCAERTWQNLKRLVTALDENGNRIIYTPYKDYGFSTLEKYPCGIQQIGKVVHDSYVDYEYIFPRGVHELADKLDYSGHLTPVNSHRYTDACEIILRFLTNCIPDSSFDETNWKKTLKPKLRSVFATGNGTFNELKKTWKKEFNYAYEYDAGAVYKRLMEGDSSKTTDPERLKEFYDYTLLLYNIKQEI